MLLKKKLKRDRFTAADEYNIGFRNIDNIYFSRLYYYRNGELYYYQSYLNNLIHGVGNESGIIITLYIKNRRNGQDIDRYTPRGYFIRNYLLNNKNKLSSR